MSKRIVILGAGESGLGAAILAQAKGFDVFVSDLGKIKEKYKKALNQYNILWEQQKHTKELIFNADEIVKSPGIPDSAPLIKQLKQLKTPIISEIELAGRYTDAKMICITGSNGKTTTALLTYHILKNAGYNVGLAGNIGESLAWQVAEKNHTHYVVELSSFQLDNMYKFKADIAILLNITPDHLDRYENSIQKYTESKFRILQNLSASDVFIFCGDDEIILKELTRYYVEAKKYSFSINKKIEPGAFLEGENMKITLDNDQFSMPKKDISLSGKHNTYNTMAAGIAGNILQIRKEIIRKCLSDFKGVEHRLEKVLKIRGIQFINDSKATNINSTWYALESMTTPTVWIVGGQDKGNDYSILHNLIKQKVKAIICLGIDNTKIHQAFDGKISTIIDTVTMKEAVRTAYYLADTNETVLLSPACASFDLFKNYEDRGNQFKKEIKNL